MSLSNEALSLQEAKSVLIGHLRTLGYGKVTLVYDGDGDEGQFTEMTATDLAGNGKDLPKYDDPAYAVVTNALETFAWEVLDTHHAGFEVDIGGCGNIVIDTANGSVTLKKFDKVITLRGKTVEV